MGATIHTMRPFDLCDFSGTLNYPLMKRRYRARLPKNYWLYFALNRCHIKDVMLRFVMLIPLNTTNFRRYLEFNRMFNFVKI
jgi:hypothetical protein